MISRRNVTQTLALVVALAMGRIASAQGLQVVSTTTTNVFNILDSIGIVIVAIAIFVAAGMLLFRAASFAVAAYVVIGGALMGGATELATWLYNAA